PCGCGCPCPARGGGRGRSPPARPGSAGVVRGRRWHLTRSTRRRLRRRTGRPRWCDLFDAVLSTVELAYGSPGRGLERAGVERVRLADRDQIRLDMSIADPDPGAQWGQVIMTPFPTP